MVMEGIFLAGALGRLTDLAKQAPVEPPPPPEYVDIEVLARNAITGADITGVSVGIYNVAVYGLAAAGFTPFWAFLIIGAAYTFEGRRVGYRTITGSFTASDYPPRQLVLLMEPL